MSISKILDNITLVRVEIKSVECTYQILINFILKISWSHYISMIILFFTTTYILFQNWSVLMLFENILDLKMEKKF